MSGFPDHHSFYTVLTNAIGVVQALAQEAVGPAKPPHELLLQHLQFAHQVTGAARTLDEAQRGGVDLAGFVPAMAALPVQTDPRRTWLVQVLPPLHHYYKSLPPTPAVAAPAAPPQPRPQPQAQVVELGADDLLEEDDAPVELGADDLVEADEGLPLDALTKGQHVRAPREGGHRLGFVRAIEEDVALIAFGDGKQERIWPGQLRPAPEVGEAVTGKGDFGRIEGPLVEFAAGRYLIDGGAAGKQWLEWHQLT